MLKRIKRSFLFGGGKVLEAEAGTVYKRPERASTGLSWLRISRNKGEGPGACFSWEKSDIRKHGGIQR